MKDFRKRNFIINLLKNIKSSYFPPDKVWLSKSEPAETSLTNKTFYWRNDSAITIYYLKHPY